MCRSRDSEASALMSTSVNLPDHNTHTHWSSAAPRSIVTVANTTSVLAGGRDAKGVTKRRNASSVAASATSSHAGASQVRRCSTSSINA